MAAFRPHYWDTADSDAGSWRWVSCAASGWTFCRTPRCVTRSNTGLWDYTSRATLDFMKWVVTSDEGTTMLAEQFGPCPLRTKTPEERVLCRCQRQGRWQVHCDLAFNWTPAVDDWRWACDALTQYTVNGGNTTSRPPSWTAGPPSMPRENG